MKKQSFPILLAALLLAAVPLSACGNAENTPDMPTGAVSETVSADTEETVTEPDYYDGLENLDCGGYRFRILSYLGDSWPLYLSSDGENGELLNDAAFRRNLEISELLNCGIEAVYDKEYEKLFQNAVHAGDDSACDLVCFFSPGARASYISENYVYDWKSVPHLRLNAPWYVQDANETFTVAGKQYFAVSDITFAGQQFASILCNLRMLESYDLPSPYTLVEEGTWTLDALHTLTSGVYADLNGNGKKDIGDQFGLVGHSNVFGRFIFCAGEPEVYGQASGFALNLYSDKITALVDRLRGMQAEDDICVDDAKSFEKFTDQTTLFALYASDPAKLRDLTFDYGYLPFPKYDEAQKNYITEAAGGHMAIPVTASDIDRTGVIVEAMSAASRKYMSEAFIESYIENKVLRDEGSVSCYRLMRETSRYNLSYNIDPTGSLASHIFYSKLWQKPSLMLASQYESQKDAFQKAYDKLFAAAEANKN